LELRELDFINCPIDQEPYYREQIFKILPNLEILDSKDKNGNIVEEEEISIYKLTFLKII